jgi:sugar/nucleoside kinase (ribokinase family)
VNVDLAVLTPAYLDYTFVGLEALPGPGEERFAGDMLRSPGGGAITAVGARRLGLNAALVAPLGNDLAGNFVRRELEAEGVVFGEARGHRTPTTVVMPVGGERSMVTVDPGVRARAADLEPLSPRAVAATLEQIDIVPEGVCAFITCGDDDARAFAGRLPRVSPTRRARGLIVNRRESAILTGDSDPEEAARKLNAVAEIAAVTLGPDGVVASYDGRSVRVDGCREAVVDTTGAGDLFAAAWAWGDLRGLDPEARLRYAVLYASLSVTTATGADGAVTAERLIAEGTRRGLPDVAA